MARRPINQGPKVQSVVFGKSSPLVTIEGDGFFALACVAGVSPFHDLEGAYVRVHVPDKATDEHVAYVREKLGKMGARAVRFQLARVLSAVPVPEDGTACKTAREVCLELAEEVPSQDRDKLRGIVESIMAEAGI